MKQQTATLIAIALVPILGPIIKRVFLAPGKAAHGWLWKRLPDGRLRNWLLRKV